MEIKQAIRKLLFLEDCVIIPGLGGFVSQYRAAVIDKATGTFTPPAKEIVFNNELLQNDGTLVSFLAEKNGITHEVAREQVDRFVDETRNKLDHNSPVFIDGVGQFIQDKNRRILFQADAGTNLFLDSYGLAPFHLREVERDTHAFIQNVLISREEESARTVEFPVTDMIRPHGNRNLRRIAIAMPLLIAFSLLPYNSRITETLSSSTASMAPEPSLFRLNYPDAMQRDTSRTIVFPISDSAAPAVVAVDNARREEVRSEEVRSTVVERPEIIKPEIKKPEIKQGVAVQAPVGKYPVIAGCFKIKENATRLHRKLVDKGYPATILTSRTGLFKVIVQSFESRTEAITGMDRLKKAEPDMQLWVAL